MSAVIKLCAAVVRQQVGRDDAEAEAWRLSALGAREEYDQLRRERDDLQAKLDAELPAAWREDVESLNGCLERASRDLYEARSEIDKLRAERRQLRARLVECRPWVGVCPFPNTPGFSEMLAIRDLADDTLEEVKP